MIELMTARCIMRSCERWEWEQWVIGPSMVTNSVINCFFPKKIRDKSLAFLCCASLVAQYSFWSRLINYLLCLCGMYFCIYVHQYDKHICSWKKHCCLNKKINFVESCLTSFLFKHLFYVKIIYGVVFGK